jgi:hypothetical protein
MRSSVASRETGDLMWKHILMLVVSAVLSALAEHLRPRKPRK